MTGRLVVVGASYAGTQLAFSARDHGFAGEIVMLGEEPRLPYQRPPLSKGYLQGKMAPPAMLLRAEAAFRRAAIELRLGERVVAIDRDAREVVLADGRRLGYSKLALTTGARVRRLSVPGHELAGIHHLRDLADAEALAAAAAMARRAVVIGGGFIGLEVAASLRGLGLEVVVVEPLDRLLKRCFPPLLSDWTLALHRRRGVDVRLGATVAAILGEAGRLCGVRLDSGEEIAGDLVVVGVGVDANDGLARDAGLRTDRGIVVDAHGMTSDPSIAAAGDCTARLDLDGSQPGGGLIRIQSVQNATEQARAAGATLAGTPTLHLVQPWFWSDQYDAKFQMVGHGSPDDEIVLRGDPESGKFSLFHFRDGRLVAVDSVGAIRDHMTARKLLAHGTELAAHQAGDAGIDLESFCRAASR